MKNTCLYALLLLCIWSFSASAQNGNKAIIGFYNVENLFDTINDPNKNDEQFLPDGSYRWTSEKYLLKLDRISEVIAEMAKMNGGLAVLGVSEIENEQVLLDLVATERLRPLGLKVCHHESPDRRGVDVAFLYNPARFKIIDTAAYPLVVPGQPEFISRDQWLMTGILDNTDTLYILVNHWPSKAGGEKRSLPGRIAAGTLSRQIADEVLQKHPNGKFILMGDLNDNPNSKAIVEYLGAQNKTKDLTPKDLYNPMWKMYHDGIGSYAYRDSWEMLDNIIISGGLVYPARPNTYKFVEAHVFRKDFMITKSGSYMGYPWRMYAGGIYQGGYSDHFPVYIVLTK
ncbi:MAG: endonuclease/exonuclease/phosphatase family protein [Bacteroidales bacterium]|nr:endonuclease/exonuclease/phosphatase family protein [Bacteroidales bacterium]